MSRDTINHAKEFILEIVSHAEDPGDRHTRTHTGMGGPMGPLDLEDGGGVLTIEISIPRDKVGRIIGKGGETIKHLQVKSGTKMIIIYAEPRQENKKSIRITGELHKVEKAKKMINKMIADKKPQAARFVNRGRGQTKNSSNDDSRGNRRDCSRERDNCDGDWEHCVGGLCRERGELNDDLGRNGPVGLGGPGFDPGGPGNLGRPGAPSLTVCHGDSMCVNSNEKVEAFLVPSNKCGLVIGKGGETIRNINQQTGAYCTLNHIPPNIQNEKQFIIRGTLEQIDNAKKCIAEKARMGHCGGGLGRERGELNNDLGRNGPVGLGGPGFDPVGPGNLGRPGAPSLTVCHGDSMCVKSNENVEAFLVPSNKCGLVIGKGGETIRNINQQTGAYCILNRIPPNIQNEKQFIIRGTLKQIDNAKKCIAEKAGMSYIHARALQKDVTTHQTKTVMKNCSGYLVPAERNGVPSAALYIDKLDCQIEIDTLKNAKYYENGQLKPLYNLQTRLSVQFDMVYNSKKRSLEAIYIWVGERPSKKRLQAFRYSSQVGEEIRKRRRIQKQERKQYIYRMQMSKLNIMLKRYLKKIPANYNLAMFNFKLLRKKSWYKKKIMKKKLKFKNFTLRIKDTNSCKTSCKRKTRGIKPTMTSSNYFIDNSTHSFSSPITMSKMNTNESNKSNKADCKCLHQNIMDSTNKLSSKKKRKMNRKKYIQCPAGYACLLVTSHNSKPKMLDPYINSKPKATSSLEFWSNKKDMKLDKNFQEALFQKVDKKLFKITENVVRIKKNASEVKQLIWTRIPSKGVKEDSGAMVLPACMKNMKRILIENDTSLKYLQYQTIPKKSSSSVRKNAKMKTPENILPNNNVQFISNAPIIQKPSVASGGPCQIKDDKNEPIKSFLIPVPLKPILKNKCNKSGKKSSKKKN